MVGLHGNEKWPASFTPWPESIEDRKAWFSIPANTNLSEWSDLVATARNKWSNLESAIRRILEVDYTYTARDVFDTSFTARGEGFDKHLSQTQRRNIGSALVAELFQKQDIAWKDEAKEWLEAAFRLLTPRMCTLWKQHRSKIKEDPGADTGASSDTTTQTPQRKSRIKPSKKTASTTSPSQSNRSATSTLHSTLFAVEATIGALDHPPGFKASEKRASKQRRLDSSSKQVTFYGQEEADSTQRKAPVGTYLVQRNIIVRVVDAEWPDADHITIGLGALTDDKYDRVADANVRADHLKWDLFREILRNESKKYEVGTDDIYRSDDVMLMELKYDDSVDGTGRLAEIKDEEDFWLAIGILDWQAQKAGEINLVMLLSKRSDV